jgi:endonuclease/exonuclease/phosphatase family metal-dependent hydrolase
MMRVLTYNIRNGGQPDRLDRIVDVVTAQRPDLVGLQELRGFDRDLGRRMREVAAATGMAPFLGRSRFGQPVAVLVRESAQVLDRGPIRRPFHHAAMSVTVATDRGPLTAISTHLNPYRGWKRRFEARWIAARIRRDRLMLVMGDLNTLDPWTDHTEQLRDLAPEFRSRHLRRGRVDSRPVEVLVDAGLVDLYRRAADTAGSAGTAGPAGLDYTAPTSDGGGTEFSRMRLDYVLGTPGVADLTRTCRIVSGGAAESASDHYPVLAEVDLSLD